MQTTQDTPEVPIKTPEPTRQKATDKPVAPSSSATKAPFSTKPDVGEQPQKTGRRRRRRGNKKSPNAETQVARPSTENRLDQKNAVNRGGATKSQAHGVSQMLALTTKGTLACVPRVNPKTVSTPTLSYAAAVKQDQTALKQPVNGQGTPSTLIPQPPQNSIVQDHVVNQLVPSVVSVSRSKSTKQVKAAQTSQVIDQQVLSRTAAPESSTKANEPPHTPIQSIVQDGGLASSTPILPNSTPLMTPVDSNHRRQFDTDWTDTKAIVPYHSPSQPQTSPYNDHVSSAMASPGSISQYSYHTATSALSNYQTPASSYNAPPWTQQVATQIDSDWKVSPELIVAMDCEMVGVGANGKRSILARASIVDWNGDILLDVFVKPSEPVTDFRTHVSGVRHEDVTSPNAITFQDCRDRVHGFLQGKVLVGHGLKNDFNALQMAHPWYHLRDSALFPPFRKPDDSGARRLKDLVAEKAGIIIQQSEHCSVEDARAALTLYKSRKLEWDYCSWLWWQATSNVSWSPHMASYQM